jgi:integrase
MQAFERLRAWSNWLEVTGHAPDTIRSYRYWALRYMVWSLADLHEASEDDLVGFLASLPANGQTRREALKAVRSYWSWAAPKAGRNPAERLHLRRRREPPVADVPTEQELRRLIRAAFRRDARWGWGILLAATTGLRVGSLVALRPEDCHGDWLWTTAAKGDRRYRVVLSRPAQIAVRHLLALSNGPTLLGVRRGGFRYWVHRAALDAGLGRVYPHLLRHAFATRLAQVADPRTWQEAMGHADLSQYPRYVHVDGHRLREAVEAVRI